MLQHVPDASQVIREMIRVTRPGGRVAALEFDQGSTMVDHPDRDTTRVIVQTFGDAMANGWIGRQLPRLFRQAGLTDLSVSPVVNLGEPAMFQAMIRSHVDRLRADNVLTASQADDWWHALQQPVTWALQALVSPWAGHVLGRVGHLLLGEGEVPRAPHAHGRCLHRRQPRRCPDPPLGRDVRPVPVEGRGERTSRLQLGDHSVGAGWPTDSVTR